jgi:Tol biopolymer transport system component
MKLGRFDRLMLILLVVLAAGLVAAGLIANQVGLRPPRLVNPVIGVAGPVEISFDQKMQAASVESRWQSDPKVSGHFGWDGQMLAFRPDAALAPGKTYTFRLEGGSLAEDGQVIRQEIRWQVSVRPAEVVFISPVADGSEIWKAAQDGSGRVKLTQTGNKVYDFGVSVSGAWIAYSVKNSQAGSDLWIVQRDGKNSRKIADCGGDSCIQPDWSPDGKWIAYSRKRLSVVQGEMYSPQPRIWTLEIASGKTSPLFQDATIGGTDPSWSPDGKHLAFFDPPAKVIHVLNTETGKELMLQSVLGVVGGWSADSQRLWYGDLVSSDSLPFGSAFVADIASDQVQQLFTGQLDPVDYGVPAPTPDGTWIAVGERFQGGSRSIQLTLMRPDGSERKKITDEATYTHGAYSWDPNGTRLLFQRVIIASSQSRPEVMIWDRALGQTKSVAQDAALPAWLP